MQTIRVTLACALLIGLGVGPACGSSSDGEPEVSGPGPSSPDSGEASAIVDAASGTDISPATDVARGDEPDAGVNLGPDVIAPMPGDGGGGYGNDGPDSYTTAALSVTNGSDTFTVNLWIPTSPGAHPVVSFSPGLQAPSAGYTPYATRLASWGFVVLMRDDPGILVSGDVVVSDLSYTVATWLPAQSTSTGSALFGKVDLTRVGLAGHSRGGQVTLDAAEEGLQGKVAAWVGLDPVNTAYTPGTAPSTNLPSIGIPTTYIGAGVATNCAPMNDNYQVLYAVSPSPSIAITVANASHTQFMDLMGCSACGALVCSPLGTANSQDVLDLAIRYLTAFFARELLGDASVGTLFQGAGAPADLAAGVIQMVSK